MPPQPTSVVCNLKSADTFSGVTVRKLKKELALGRILGSYDSGCNIIINKLLAGACNLGPQIFRHNTSA